MKINDYLMTMQKSFFRLFFVIIIFSSSSPPPPLSTFLSWGNPPELFSFNIDNEASLIARFVLKALTHGGFQAVSLSYKTRDKKEKIFLNTIFLPFFSFRFYSSLSGHSEIFWVNYFLGFFFSRPLSLLSIAISPSLPLVCKCVWYECVCVCTRVLELALVSVCVYVCVRAHARPVSVPPSFLRVL